MAEFEIRPARSIDAEPIARVHIESWQWAYRGLLPNEYLDQLSLPEKTREWERGLTTTPPHIYVAQDSDLLGFCAAGPDRDSRTEGEVYAIYVRPRDARKGVGTALLARCLNTFGALGFVRAHLWVLAGNTIGIAFYEKQGWKPDGQTKDDVIGGRTVQKIRLVSPIQPAE